jgi:hypothetical protein
LSLPYLVVQGRENPVNNPSYAQDFCVGEGERKEKKKKGEKWRGKRKEKKIFCSSSNSPFPSHFLLKLIFLFHFFLESGFFFLQLFP